MHCSCLILFSFCVNFDHKFQMFRAHIFFGNYQNIYMTRIIINTVIIYFFLILAIRLMGKRQLGELQLSELITTILLSEIASSPITSNKMPIFHAIISILIIIALEIILPLLMSRFTFLKRIIEGRPSYIIFKGKLSQKEMMKNRITVEIIKRCITVVTCYFGIL